LTELEENAVLKYILDLDMRGFPPRLADVGDMANILLADRDAGRVGKHWASNFVKRQPELQTRFTRAYDYQRALCEDPKKIDAWFALVRNMRAKYGIQDADLYNFDETGFMMGIITPSMVVTRAERNGRAKTVQPGNREWATVIQGVNAEGWCIPPFIVVKGVIGCGLVGASALICADAVDLFTPLTPAFGYVFLRSSREPDSASFFFFSLQART
jgi:hypothetical protein